jgi:hypothetical protein
MMARRRQCTAIRTAYRVGLLTWMAMPVAHASPHAQTEPACAGVGRKAYAPWVFLGYACDGHCREHKAGFAWAERNGIGNPAACAGPAGPFAEGCRAYAQCTVTAEQAGFEWASENELADACECDGAGQAFEAGCEAYLRVTVE